MFTAALFLKPAGGNNSNVHKPKKKKTGTQNAYTIGAVSSAGGDTKSCDTLPREEPRHEQRKPATKATDAGNVQETGGHLGQA